MKKYVPNPRADDFSGYCDGLWASAPPSIMSRMLEAFATRAAALWQCPYCGIHAGEYHRPGCPEGSQP